MQNDAVQVTVGAICMILIVAVSVHAFGLSQVTVPEMTNLELSEKVVELEKRIEHLESDYAMHHVHISNLEKSFAGQNVQINPLPLQRPIPVVAKSAKLNPLWGMVAAGMTEGDVQQLIGSPASISGSDTWKQWNYPDGGCVLFARPEQIKQVGLQLPDQEDYTVSEWSSPDP